MKLALSHNLSAPLGQGGGGPPPVVAPAVREVLTPVGDSWTEENQQILSRTGSSTVSDGWTYQLAADLGVTRYTTPTQTGVTTGVIRAGYGGQVSSVIDTNHAAIIAGEAIRASDTWIMGPGRNDTPNAAGDVAALAAIDAMLGRIPHDRKIVWPAQGGIGGTTQSASGIPSWVRSKKLLKALRSTSRRKYLFELDQFYRGLSPNGSDGGAASDVDVAGDALPTYMRASAGTDQQHPNYLSAPKWVAAFSPVVKAMWNHEVYALDATITPPFDMAAGAKLEVYFRGHVTACSITADDLINPGLFVIAMKSGSTDTAELTRTSVSPGSIPQTLNLQVTATGVDATGAAKTSNAARIRIAPALEGSSDFTPRGVTLGRDTNATATSRRFPYIATEAALFANGTKTSLVFCMKPGEDGTNMNFIVGANLRIIINRTNGNKFVFVINDSAGAAIMNWTSTTVNVTVAGGMVWVALSLDMNGGTPIANLWMWQGGSDSNQAPATALNYRNGTIALSDYAFFFQQSSGQVNFKGSILLLWWADDFIDFSNSVERRKFWNTNGSPVNLGATGAVNGITPELYLPGAEGDWINGTNFGSGTQLGFNDTWLKGFGSNSSEPTPFLPRSDISTLEVVASTPLLDATGDYGDATSRTGVNGAGWVAKATMPYLAAQTFDPAMITLTVRDPGYDATGSTTVTRAITGRAVLRRQYNAASSKQIANDGATFTVYFSLSDWIYAGTTVVSAEARAGFYGSSTAGSILNLANSSDLAYPKPLFGWLNLQHERWTGDTVVEAVAAHQHARNGRQVARVEFTATDASAHTAATQTANSVALSTLITQGNKPEVYSATIPLTALTQADLCLVNAKVYPWIGDSSAVLDLTVDGTNPTGALTTSQAQTPLRFVNDKAGTYGGGYAYVKAAAAGTPQVNRTAATARANPYATINAALAACQTFNNANSGHNDHSGCIIRLMDDGASGAVAHTISAAMSGVAAGNAMTVIEVDPLASGAVSLSIPTTRAVADKLHWKVNITQTSAAGLQGVNTNNNYIQAFDGLTLATANSSIPINYQMGICFVRNVTSSGGSNAPYFSDYSNVRAQNALVAGCIDTQSATDAKVQGAVMVGNTFRRRSFSLYSASYATNDQHDGFVVLNNKFMDMRATTQLVSSWSIVKGLVFVQNVIERAVSGSGVVPALQISADSVSSATNNVVDHHNTVVGERTNRAYSDTVGTVGVIKKIASRFNIWNEYNCKSDTFPGSGTDYGRVGNWSNRYTVGHLGNVCLTGAQDNDNTPNQSGSSWLGEVWPAATYNVLAANVTFTNDQSLTGGSAGLGTYTLTHGGTDAAVNQVPAGLAVLSYDLAGTARPNDGTGAAGAYQ